MYPGRDVPTRCKQTGVEIGDIGIITQHDGAFQYYFNIFHPPGHSENPADLPDAFLWTGPDLSPTKKNRDREVYKGYRDNVATCTLIDSPALEYTMCASQWAIVITPNGSKSWDLDESQRQMLLRHLKPIKGDVRKYLVEKHGIEIENYPLHLVIGCTKTNAWGMATASDPRPFPQPCTLKLRANLESPMIPGYEWDPSEDFVSKKSGPGLNEIQGRVRGESEDDIDVQERFNQCLFVRTIAVQVEGGPPDKGLQGIGDLPMECDMSEGSNCVGPSMRAGLSNSDRPMNDPGRNTFDSRTYGQNRTEQNKLTLENMDRPEVPRSSSTPSSSRNSSHRSRSLHGKSSTHSKERQSTVSSNKSSHTSSRPISPCPTVSSISSSLSTPPLSISSSFSDVSMSASPRSISKPIPILTPVEETSTYTTPELGVEDVNHHEDIDPDEKAMKFTDGRDDPSPSSLQEQLPQNPIMSFSISLDEFAARSRHLRF
ncbi:hypothetical protein M413DRAFT_13045 [Hebeloma cylindrosporum]|uniref:Uncharacterized protein n=1 Tax=Hebeloma cylindrosporum TaxID=76867 RepID=A0A0C3C3E7_HEBCY|nr:hypothetical protein M413DRAFT_13045 [Hebeloma cylindrosporum h7]